MLRCPTRSRRAPSLFWSWAPWPAVASDEENHDAHQALMIYALWIVQGLLAAVFLFSGGMKLVLPLEKMTGPVPLPGLFLRFLGVVEILGALGLILPGLLRIRSGLTPLAAAGLVIIMIGATVITLVGVDVVLALIPLV